MKPFTQFLLMGVVVLVMISATDALMSRPDSQHALNAWRAAYNKPALAQGASQNWLDRNANINQWNANRQPNSYLKSANSYSDQSYDQFANGHLGSRQEGFNKVNGTKKHRRGLHGGKLAGVIIGSVIGGFLILAGIISACIAWRRHSAKKRSTMYADYRSNYNVDRRDPYVDRQAPQEYYRESHRNTLNQGYANETTAADRFRDENLYRANYADRDVLVPRPTSSETVSFHN
eukprot:gene18952-22680_t